jgi:hypothetical protein
MVTTSRSGGTSTMCPPQGQGTDQLKNFKTACNITASRYSTVPRPPPPTAGPTNASPAGGGNADILKLLAAALHNSTSNWGNTQPPTPHVSAQPPPGSAQPAVVNPFVWQPPPAPILGWHPGPDTPSKTALLASLPRSLLPCELQGRFSLALQPCNLDGQKGENCTVTKCNQYNFQNLKTFRPVPRPCAHAGHYSLCMAKSANSPERTDIRPTDNQGYRAWSEPANNELGSITSALSSQFFPCNAVLSPFF